MKNDLNLLQVFRIGRIRGQFQRGTQKETREANGRMCDVIFKIIHSFIFADMNKKKAINGKFVKLNENYLATNHLRAIYYTGYIHRMCCCSNWDTNIFNFQTQDRNCYT